MLSIKAVYKRDHGTCHLCEKPVVINRRNHPLTGTRDHVVPRRDGGTNEEGYIRLAHKFCNERRGHMSVSDFRDLLSTTYISAKSKIPKWRQAMRTEAEKRRERRNQILEKIQNA